MELNFLKISTVHCDRYLDFEKIFLETFNLGLATVNRKGDIQYSIYNANIIMGPNALPICVGRGASKAYLEKELDFYLSGSLKVDDAVKASSFWKHCSDNGKEINSNYGFLQIFEKNVKGNTGLEFVIKVFKQNLYTKKAVIPVFSLRHAYLSNDNPCSMYIKFLVEDDLLNMKVCMRSNDLNFGLPYDLVWYRILQCAVVDLINQAYEEEVVKLGYYIHSVDDLHVYEKSVPKLKENLKLKSDDLTEENFNWYISFMNSAKERLIQKYNERNEVKNVYMQEAYRAAEKSKCLKKRCGAVLVINGEIVSSGFGDSLRGCTSCARDSGEKFYSDGCFSIHAEQRAIIEALKKGIKDFENAVMYVTHGPCDACCKFMEYVGIKHCVYHIPYKVDYEKHWKNLNIKQLEDN